jgi:hypothetical protein
MPHESAVDISYDRVQTVAPNIHVLALLRRLEIRPHMDPVDS